MNRLLILLTVFLALISAQAQGPDEQYVQVYQLIQEADRLNDQGQARKATAKYLEAQDALTRFRTVFPGWNERVITYRLGYVATKLAPLSSAVAGGARATVVTTNVAPVSSPPVAVGIASPPAPSARTNESLASAEFERQLKALQAEMERLQSENQTLAARLKDALSVPPAVPDPGEAIRAQEQIRALQKDNDLLKAQQARKQTAPPVSAELSAKLAEQNKLVSTLRTENDVLKKQTDESRQKYDALVTAVNKARAKAQPDPKPTRKEETALAKLSSENIALQQQVELWKQVALHNERAPAPVVSPVMSPDAERELQALRARVQVLEAKPVPYSAVELALFDKAPSVFTAAVGISIQNPAPPPPAIVVSSPANPPRLISRGVPPGAGLLMRAAEDAFARGNYAEAERKYLEVLRQDENNVTTLGNVASAQVELEHFADAEKTVQRALQIDPDEHFNLYVLGRIRFRQNKLDEALDALSRSAKADPNYADTQNYLGIVLSEKGQRGPAEAALRRAIQLQPDFAVAHNNLAVVYATQTPPALALARWHYQKALSAGHPKNAELEKMIDLKP